VGINIADRVKIPQGIKNFLYLGADFP